MTLVNQISYPQRFLELVFGSRGIPSTLIARLSHDSYILPNIFMNVNMMPTCALRLSKSSST